MSLEQLKINNFRNLQAVNLELNSGFNLILGTNGSGKTSLLEAIFFLSHGRSFKTNLSNRIINHHQNSFDIFAKINQNQNNYNVGIVKDKTADLKLKINGGNNHKISSLAKLLPLQLITPEGLNLLSSGPKLRRGFIDWGLFFHHPNFHGLWLDFKRIMKQRNAALATARSYNDIEIWDKSLIPIAQQISQMRQNYVAAIKQKIEQSVKLFLPEVQIDISFYQGWDNDSEFGDILRNNFERDYNLGYSFSGPQKADLRFKTNNIAVEDVLSRGQLKLLICALKIAQGEFLSEQSQQNTIFLLDDFSAELDHCKQKLLADRLIKSNSQVFITAINQEQLQQMKIENFSTFYIKNGKINPN